MKVDYLKNGFRRQATDPLKCKHTISIELISLFTYVLMKDQNYLSIPSKQRSLKLELLDGSVQEIEYETPIDRYDLLRIIYHDLKYDQTYDWDTFYQTTTFVRADNGITALSPLNYSSDDIIYILVLPNNTKSMFVHLLIYLFFI
jgi:hypothetical protein